MRPHRHTPSLPVHLLRAVLAAILCGSLLVPMGFVWAEEGSEPIVAVASESRSTEGPSTAAEDPEGGEPDAPPDEETPEPEADPQPLVEGVGVQAYQAGVGWRAPVGDGGSAGAIDSGLALRAIRLTLEGPVEGSVDYRVRQGAWSGWVSDGTTAGGIGSDISAIQIRLAGPVAESHDLYYRVESLVGGWLGWARAGETAGSAEGVHVGMDAIQVVLVPKGAKAPSGTSAQASATYALPRIQFTARGAGREEYQPVSSGAGVGTAGIPLLDVRAWLDSSPSAGSIQYRARIGGSWTPWAGDGASLNVWSLEPITRVEFRLTGRLAGYYDLWYHTHVAGVGWMGYAQGPYSAGVAVDRLSVEAIQLSLVPKGQAAPGSTSEPCLMDVGRYNCGQTTPEGEAIVRACFEVPSPGSGLCAKWVSQVTDRAVGRYHWLDADGMYYRLHETDRSRLAPGMTVAVSTHGHTYLGGLYGHVAIYIGNGLVMENVSYIRTSAGDSWFSYYSDRVPVRFGWL